MPLIRRLARQVAALGADVSQGVCVAGEGVIMNGDLETLLGLGRRHKGSHRGKKRFGVQHLQPVPLPLVHHKLQIADCRLQERTLATSITKHFFKSAICNRVLGAFLLR
jgi:hypothetical protein